MNASMPEYVGKVYQNRLDLLLSIQDIGKESGWDFVSQQMETSEVMMRLTRNQMSNLFRARTPGQGMETMGRWTVDLGKTFLDHAIVTTGITRDAEHQAMEVLMRYLTACLHGIDEKAGRLH
ncbi:MAG: hypothetical protein HQL84_07290 [Magnetococcales bacterium]|nr:hypothetical protein [Magnetococcales bacterium]MBF0149834.1 hypothetical protein [Magnetococcales bacterium]MBF0174603.1 hypothetical protein [Magnetococcales bacterium]MBF0346572.1 hypothetical protein [Magnetococcales bacterium]MBF0631130.1 hypothetical protein [Magnetococcales bacterium]